MRRQIEATLETVLLEADDPEIILVRDRAGQQYLCALSERDSHEYTYLAVALSESRLADFRAGRVDLLELLTEPETGLQYSAVADLGGKAVGLTLLDEEPPARWLPKPGFLLSTFYERVDDSEVVRQAAAKNATVITCHIEPANGRHGTSAIDADRLSLYVSKFQSLVRHAWTRVRPLNAVGYVDDPTLQVLAFSQGSFRVHFESKYSANVYGSSDVGAALTRVDELMATLRLPQAEAVEVLRGNRGHVISAYRDLLDLVGGEEAPLEYRWAEPSMSESSGATVYPVEARAMATLIRTRSELGKETRVFVGTFTRVNMDFGTWRVATVTPRGRIKHYGGKLHEAAPENLLRGVVIDEGSYRLVCEERIEERFSGGTGAILYLQSLGPAQ